MFSGSYFMNHLVCTIYIPKIYIVYFPVKIISNDAHRFITNVF